MLVILAALPDLLDGALAKASNTSSQRGAFFDSTVDRVTDALLLGGIAYYFAETRDPRLAVLPFAVSAVSSVISYQRAKAESLGLDAKGGLMERAERIVVLCVGLFLEPWVDGALVWILWGMLVLITITAVQRFVKVWKQAAVAPVTQARIDLRRERRAVAPGRPHRAARHPRDAAHPDPSPARLTREPQHGGAVRSARGRCARRVHQRADLRQLPVRGARHPGDAGAGGPGARARRSGSAPTSPAATAAT